jgi:hypothetical protein
MLQQSLRRQSDERAIVLSRAATIVAVVVFVGWLAYFGVTAPWDLGGRHGGLAEFFGRFFGLIVLMAAIFSPLIVVGAARRKP